MLKDIITAIQAYFQANRFIAKHKLWKWIFIPGLIYALLLFVGMYFFWISSGYAIEWMFLKIGIKGWMDKMNDSWLSFLFIFGRIMLHLVFYFFIFRYLNTFF